MNSRRRSLSVGCMSAAVIVVALVGQGRPVVTFQDLLIGLNEPGRWLTVSGDYTGRRHSPLVQLTPQNVGRLAARWTFQTDIPGKFEFSFQAEDGIRYVTGINNNAW